MLPVSPSGNIYAGIAGTMGSNLQGDLCRNRTKKSKVKTMKDTGILIAGIFLTYVVCAGIPAVAAADNPMSSYTPMPQRSRR